MFRTMRRVRQELPFEECEEILRRNTSGVLATVGCEGYPYAVPLSYVYVPADEGIEGLGTLMFHCGRKGHKVDALRRDPHVSFCVIDRDDVAPAEFATHYMSVVAFGRARFVEDSDEKRRLLTMLGEKYSPGMAAETQAEIDAFWQATCVVVIEIDHISGKQAKALAG
ncbi:MAG: pyridoxamine 5'-phosphate oxidase family protein [Eggerthellaceae bacterium]|nr:pyridoxamine 5'-phosphate oxidase family protein [Eggerthellaceae bacterium]